MDGPELYKLFFEEASDAFFAAQLPECRLFSVNKAFEALTGFSREELEGEALSVLSSLVEDRDVRERKLNAEILQTPGFYNDIALSTRDGALRFVTAKIRHIQTGGKKIALVVLSDDTERQLMLRDLTTKHQTLETAYIDLERVHHELKFTQEQMHQSAKLVALGEVAAGMSHELNQPLTGIRGFAQEIGDIISKSPKPSKKDIAHYCEEIITNSDKMAALLSHFREFARSGSDSPGTRKPEPVEFNKVIESALTLLQRQLANHNIEVELRGFEKPVWIEGVAHPLEQVLINLLTNSRDAIDEKRRTKAAKGRIVIQADGGPQGEILIRVTDNGCGIPDSIRAKIFDPFVSSKEPGKGMGLGLSISFGIVHGLGGQLILENSAGHGTTFLLKLKAAKALSKSARSKAAA